MRKSFFLTIICSVLIVAMLFNISKNNGVYADTQNTTIFKNLTSKSYILVDVDSNTVLTSHNEDEKMPVASICKLMTTLLVLEELEVGNLSLEDKIVASPYACSAEGSQAFLDAGSKYEIRELLKSVIMASANDSAIVLAEKISGNENLFVKKMNERAKELGMENTIYENATGLNTENQYSTARDTVKILKEVSKHDIYNQDSKIWMDELVHPSGRVTQLVNTNRLIKYYDYCVSGKTGFTDEAGYCLASFATNDNLNLIAVTLNCKDASSRFRENMELFNYGFANFENVTLLTTTDKILNTIKINGGKNNEIELVVIENCSVIKNKGIKDVLSLKYELPKIISAPVNAGDIVGKVKILRNGVEEKEIDVICSKSIKKQNYGNIINKISKSWSII